MSAGVPLYQALDNRGELAPSFPSFTFTVAVRSDASQMPLVMAASGPRLMTPPPLRPGQNLVGRLRCDRLPERPEHLPNFRHGHWEEFDAHIDRLLVGPPFATWLLLVGWLR